MSALNKCNPAQFYFSDWSLIYTTCEISLSANYLTYTKTKSGSSSSNIFFSSESKILFRSVKCFISLHVFIVMNFLLYNYEMHISSLYNRLKCKRKKILKPKTNKKATYLHGALTAILAFVNYCFQHLFLTNKAQRVAAQVFYNWLISVCQLHWRVWQERKVLIWYLCPFNIGFSLFKLMPATKINQQILYGKPLFSST